VAGTPSGGKSAAETNKRKYGPEPEPAPALPRAVDPADRRPRQPHTRSPCTEPCRPQLVLRVQPRAAPVGDGHRRAARVEPLALGAADLDLGQPLRPRRSAVEMPCVLAPVRAAVASSPLPVAVPGDRSHGRPFPVSHHEIAPTVYQRHQQLRINAVNVGLIQPQGISGSTQPTWDGRL
jgi:hypothetical protein